MECDTAPNDHMDVPPDESAFSGPATAGCIAAPSTSPVEDVIPLLGGVTGGVESPCLSCVPSCTVPAVVLAAGRCEDLHSFSVNTPKALLPVGNKSLICGTLECLLCSGIRKVLIITDASDGGIIESHVRRHFCECRGLCGSTSSFVDMDVTFHALVDRNNVSLGTADALKYVSEKICGDFLVVPCDLYGPFDFRGLIEAHKSSARLCTIALIEDDRRGKIAKRTNENAEDQVAPGGNRVRGWGYKYRVMVTVDTSISQLIGISDIVGLSSGECYEISKWLLLRHPRCTLRRDLYDAHIYMFSKDIVKVANLFHMSQSSIRLDLLPYIVRMQETPTSLSWFYGTSPVALDVVKPCSMAEFNSSVDYGPTRVFYHLGLGDASQCCRVNSLESLMSSNMQACLSKSSRQVPPRTQLSSGKIRDAIVGSGCTFGSGVNVRCCVFGSNVCVGKGCKLSRCVIMDNVTIDDNVVLDNCMLWERCTVYSRTTMKYVVVAPDQTVPAGTCLERDLFPPFMDN